MKYKRCVSFCTAVGYQLPAVASFFKSQNYQVKTHRKMLLVYRPGGDRTVFVFAHGCFVTWGFTQQEERKWVEKMGDFSTEPLLKIETDRFAYFLGAKTEMMVDERFNVDLISLEEGNEAHQLAISYGLAQSIKLESYEEAIQKSIEKNEPLSINLAKRGSILLSRNAIAKRMGEIFLARSSINLNSEYLEVPEYFWEHPNIEAYYVMSEKFLDIHRRVSVLNQKLDVSHELFDMLTSQLQHRYSSFLEFIIIALIFIEIILTLAHW